MPLRKLVAVATRAIASWRCSVTLHIVFAKDHVSDPYDRSVANIKRSVEASGRELAAELHDVFPQHCEATGAWRWLLGANKIGFV